MKNRTQVSPDTDALLDQIESARHALVTAILSRPGQELRAAIINRDVEAAMDDIIDADRMRRRVAA